MVAFVVFEPCIDRPGFVATNVSMDVGWKEGTLIIGLVYRDGGAFDLLVPAENVDEGKHYYCDL